MKPIIDLHYVQDFDPQTFLERIRAISEDHQTLGRDVEVQYGGRGSSGAPTALLVVRG